MSDKNIIICDDEVHIRRLVEINLQKAGYKTVQASDGVECLEKLRDNSISTDMVILDVMMPRKDGFETLKEMMADDKLKDIPVIMLTAKAQDKDIFIGWASGVSAYLTKPFNPRELLVFVERIFQAQEYEEVETDVFIV